MDDEGKILDYAKGYVYRRHTFGVEDNKTVILNRSLQYLLVSAVKHILDEFGEVTKIQVVQLIETWIIAQGTAPGCKKPCIGYRRTDSKVECSSA